jgi:hypothetical protein
MVTLMLPITMMLSLTGCSSVPTKDIQITTQADPKVNFDAYTTYTWAGSISILRDPTGQWEPPEFDADKEIKHLIDRELRKHGMMESSTNPEVFVGFALGTDTQALKIKTDPKTDMDVIEAVPAGGLLLVLIDAESGLAAWAGLATAELMEKPDTQTAQARLDYTVTKMLKDLK